METLYTPLVSVIVPVFNAECYLDACIKSITNQTYDNIEIILIDDGSTDKSSELCELWKCRDSRIHVEHVQNQGVSVARNIGINVSKGEYITFVDSDDELITTGLETLIKGLYNSQDFVVGLYNTIDTTNETCTSPDLNLISSQGNIKNDYYTLYMALGALGLIAPWGILFRRDVIINNNLHFPKGVSFGEDLVFNCNYISNVNTYCIVKDTVYKYFKRGNVTLSDRFNEKRVDDEVKTLDFFHEWLTRENIKGKDEIISMRACNDFFTLSKALLSCKNKSIDSIQNKFFDLSATLVKYFIKQPSNYTFKRKILFFLVKTKCYKLVFYLLSKKV